MDFRHGDNEESSLVALVVSNTDDGQLESAHRHLAQMERWGCDQEILSEKKSSGIKS